MCTNRLVMDLDCNNRMIVQTALDAFVGIANRDLVSALGSKIIKQLSDFMGGNINSINLTFDEPDQVYSTAQRLLNGALVSARLDKSLLKSLDFLYETDFKLLSNKLLLSILPILQEMIKSGNTNKRLLNNILVILLERLAVSITEHDSATNEVLINYQKVQIIQLLSQYVQSDSYQFSEELITRTLRIYQSIEMISK